jgi:gluconolactonase
MLCLPILAVFSWLLLSTASRSSSTVRDGGPNQASAPAAESPRVVRLDPALDQLVDAAAPVELVASGFVFTEGPMWREGRLWFSDEEGGKTVAVTPEGKVTVLIDYTQPPFSAAGKLGPNAMATAPDGSVILCEQYARAVERLVPGPGESGPHPVPFFSAYEGKRLNSPNDLVFAADGSFFFTDPPYGLKERDADPKKELAFDGVFHVKDGKLTPVITDLTLPNGVALSPDGRTLYVNNSGPAERVIAYPLHSDGSVGPAHDIIDFTGSEGRGIPDGLKVDSLGNLWTTGPGGIRIVTPAGKVLGQIKLPVVAANLAWGEDGHSLYITASGNIYRLHTRVHGPLPTFTR